MKTYKIFNLIFALVFAFSLLGIPASVSAQESTGAITGIVRDYLGTPISNAWVCAINYDGYPGANCQATDPGGIYILDGLPGGDYRVDVRASGWRRVYFIDTFDSNAATRVTVTAPATTSDINFVLEERAGSISGFVHEVDGQTPIANVFVWFDGGNKYRDGACTNADGHYTIENIPYGVEGTLFAPKGYWGTGGNLCNGDPITYVTEYWQEVPGGNSATKVKIDATSPIFENIDFTLEHGGTISGTVHDAISDDPIPGMILWVNLWGESGDGSIVGNVCSDASGNFLVENVPFGETLIVQTIGWLPFCGGSQDYIDAVWGDGWNNPTYLWLDANTPSINDINFRLEKSGAISGTVLDNQNNSIANARVCANKSDTGWDGGCTNSDSDGNYRIQLVGGTYRVDAQAEGWDREFYDNVTDESAATPVSVVAGEETQNINFSLEPPVYIPPSITGIVTDEGGAPIPDAWVDAYMYDGGQYAGGGSSGSDGSYSINGLPAGDYRVEVYAGGWAHEYYNDTHDWNDASRVMVTTSETTLGINFSLEPGGSISGMVQDDSGNRIENAYICANAYDENFTLSCASSGLDGSYAINDLPVGDYRVEVSASGWVHEFYNDIHDWNAASRVTVVASQTTSDINFSLEPSGSISGIVQDDDGNRIENALICAHPYDGSGGNCASSGSDGNYIIGGLPTGEYRVNVQASGWLIEFYNNTYDWYQAYRVPVNAPETTSGIDFSMTIRAGPISGTVVDAETNEPIAGMYVSWGGNIGGVYDDCTDAEGHFMIQNIPFGVEGVLSAGNSNWTPRRCDGPDDYVPEFWEETPSDWFAIRVTLSEEMPMIDDIAFTLEHGGSISATIYESNGTTPIPNINFIVQSEIGLLYIGCSDQYGKALAENLPFGVDLYVQTPTFNFCGGPNYYLSEWWQEIPYFPWQWQDPTIIKLDENNSSTEVAFTLERGGWISGTVYDNESAPLPDAQVCISPFVGESWRECTQTDSDGSYQLSWSPLPVGDYLVEVDTTGWLHEFYNNVYDRSAAMPVSVEAMQETQNINFTLNLPDSDGDGLNDDVDACPNENPNGYDADHNGCTDTATDLRLYLANLPANVIPSNIKASLLANVDSAITLLNRGREQGAIGQLNDFIKLVEAQRGKKITIETADLLITYARNIIAGIP